MKIGVFDSGLGGLTILKSVMQALPQYNYIYLGDTKHMPYGSRTQSDIYRLTRDAVDFLFAKDCVLVILACNTASARALRKLQRTWLPKHYPNRRVLGVIVPTVEATIGVTRVGVLATPATVKSGVYGKEFKKINPKAKVWTRQSKVLAGLIDAGKRELAQLELARCIENLRKDGAREVLLACTHYALLKDYARKKFKQLKIISQDEIVPRKLKDYLRRHRGIAGVLGKQQQREYILTKRTPAFRKEIEQFSEDPRLRGKDFTVKTIKVESVIHKKSA
ncbi:MAG TPA: glutamate racemase [Patescibacteria group bacterium]|nr:glutamate racemase [Patescibacteria group bacterium]